MPEIVIVPIITTVTKNKLTCKSEILLDFFWNVKLLFDLFLRHKLCFKKSTKLKVQA